MVGFAGEVPCLRHSYDTVFVLSLHPLTAYYQAIFSLNVQECMYCLSLN